MNVEISKKQNIFWQYLSWQLWDVPRNILKGWNNFLKFGLNYFSVPLLIKTFFSHWHRYRWPYPRGFDPWEYFETFISNLISRTLGAVFRFPLIIIGILLEIFIFFAGLILFLGWFLLPIFLILGIYHGFRLLL